MADEEPGSQHASSATAPAAAVMSGGGRMRPMSIESDTAKLTGYPRVPDGVTKALASHKRVLAGVLLLLAIVTLMAVVYKEEHPDSAPLLSPVVSGEAVVFLAVGDWGRLGNFNQREVGVTMGESANELSPQFVISTGDNYYENGVLSPDDVQFNTSWRDVYTHANLSALPWHSVLGNHDYRGVLGAQVDYTDDPRWVMPALNYTMTWPLPGVDASSSPTACLSAVFIDTSPFIQYYRDGKEDKGNMAANMNASDPVAQLAWATAALAAAAASCDAVIVVGHHPLYSGAEHANSPELIEAFSPLLLQYGVDVVLHGHDHTLTHLRANETEFVITGAGSKVRGGTLPTPELVWFADVNGFTVHSFNATHMGIAFIDGLDHRNVLHTLVKPLRPKPR